MAINNRVECELAVATLEELAIKYSRDPTQVLMNQIECLSATIEQYERENNIMINITETEKNKVQEIDVLDQHKQLTYKCQRVEGTNVTVCVALTPKGFMVAQGWSSCISDQAIGERVAMKEASENALQALWKLNGYDLAKSLNKMF